MLTIIQFTTIMMRIIKLLLLLILGIFGYGLYLQYYVEDANYSKVMGSGVLLLVFILLPLFLHHRYKDKNIDDYRFKGFNNEKKNDA